MHFGRGQENGSNRCPLICKLKRQLKQHNDQGHSEAEMYLWIFTNEYYKTLGIFRFLKLLKLVTDTKEQKILNV